MPLARPLRRLLSGLAVTVLSIGGLSACSGTSESDVAALLAKGLSSRDLSAVPLVSGSPAQASTDLAAITAGLGDLRDAVSVNKVTVQQADDGSTTADAVLDHSWTIPAGLKPDGSPRTSIWSYQTTAKLSQTDDGWAVRWAPSVVADLADGEKLSLTRAQPPRADIVGAGAAILVTNRPVLRYGLDKGKLTAEQVEASARALAALVGVNPDSYATRAVAAGPKQFVEAIAYRADAVPPPAQAGYAEIPGAVVVRSDRALAPTKDFARPILGSVGEATAELVDSDPARYHRGDVVGLSGLQRRYEQQLGGTPGAAVVAARDGGQPRTMFQINAENGQPLALTIDPTMQTIAEESLAQVGPASAAVVVRASTGEILAVASGPGSEGYSTATLGKYAPGSTFKVVTALALLRTGLTPDSPVECPATITVDGRTFSNYSDFPTERLGTMTLRDALATSCNTAFIGAAAAQAVTPEQLTSAARSLGVDWDAKATGADVFTGSVPTEGTATEAAANRIGQGKVTASPLAMATVMASILNGSTVTPRLVSDPPPPTPATVERPVTAEEAQALRDMMAAVVTSGTGSVVAGVPNQPVIAKTGTAEYGDTDPPATRAWMIAGRGDLALAVFVAEGPSGSKTAGPIMADLLTRLPA